jgi:hypothetical protein
MENSCHSQKNKIQLLFFPKNCSNTSSSFGCSANASQRICTLLFGAIQNSRFSYCTRFQNYSSHLGPCNNIDGSVHVVRIPRPRTLDFRSSGMGTNCVIAFGTFRVKLCPPKNRVVAWMKKKGIAFVLNPRSGFDAFVIEFPSST